MIVLLLKMCLYLLAGGQLFPLFRMLCADNIVSGQSSYRSEGKRFCCVAEWGLDGKRVCVGESVRGLLSHYGILRIV